MRYPNLSEEKKSWAKGYQFVAGLDEAGRGPLAGPVVSASVFVNLKNKKHPYKLEFVRMFFGMRDSKKLSKKQRDLYFKKLTSHDAIKWGIGIVSEELIDKKNILNATKLAMKKALKSISKKIGKKVDFLLIDGNFALNGVNIPQKSIIKGDEKVFSCTAAGIIAKVSRDKIMQEFHIQYPQYGFDKHKGYGTKLHIKMLNAFGPSKIHRKSFYPVSTIYKSQVV